METSIHIERLFGHSLKVTEINNRLKKSEVLTSKYVLKEFKAAILKDMVFLYAVVKDEESIADADIHIKKSRAYHPKTQARCSHILTQIAEAADFKKERVLAAIKRYLDWELLILFEEPITKYTPDEIECYIAKDETRPQFKYERYFFDIPCTKGMKKCKIDEFIGKKAQLFMKIHDYLKKKTKLDKELSQVKDLCPKICKNPSQVRWSNNCKILGDSVIAIEAPDKCRIYTTNLKHFKPISKALEKKDPIGGC
jgi:hypothetical protein